MCYANDRRTVCVLCLSAIAAWLVACNSSLLLAVPTQQPADAAPRPNILIIFTDDQGYADLGCSGNQKHRTPRMDRLAAEGTRFPSF